MVRHVSQGATHTRRPTNPMTSVQLRQSGSAEARHSATAFAPAEHGHAACPWPVIGVADGVRLRGGWANADPGSQTHVCMLVKPLVPTPAMRRAVQILPSHAFSHHLLLC